MLDYPTNIIEAFKTNKISRLEFKKQYRDWQLARGIDYACRGKADQHGTYLFYRGITGTIRGGVIYFHLEHKYGIHSEWTESIDEFCRKVDIHLNKMNFPFGNIGSAHRGCRQ